MALNTKNSFSVILKRILKEKGLTSKDAAKMLDIYPQQFGTYVRGEFVPRFDDAVEMLQKLDYTILPIHMEDLPKQ